MYSGERACIKRIWRDFKKYAKKKSLPFQAGTHFLKSDTED